MSPKGQKDETKIKIQSNKDAIKLSKLMRQNLHYNLIIFYELYSNGFKNFLESFFNCGKGQVKIRFLKDLNFPSSNNKYQSLFL